MTPYPVHTIETAPEGSKASLRALEETLGMIPNLAASMAESPELIRGFLAIRKIFAEGTFTPTEIQILSLTNAFENGCPYCMALHSALALKEGASKATVEALREGRSPVEAKFKALSDFSRTLVRERGRAHPREFLAAGYTKAQALEVVLGIAASILPNFAHHLTEGPVDKAFQAHLWTDPRAMLRR
ncbi:MAG TPA: carboxymuconolactone decarboxylase family protein [Planctomycetota bacterium]|nr:carboxymuconolactone decarboxylase family protein [Planctomycetota bacterium]